MTNSDIFAEGLMEFGVSLDGYGRTSMNIGIVGTDDQQIRVYLNRGENLTQIYCPLGEYDIEFLEETIEGMAYGVAKVGRLLVLSTSIPTPELSFQIVEDTIFDIASWAISCFDNPKLQNPWPTKPIPQE